MRLVPGKLDIPVESVAILRQDDPGLVVAPCIRPAGVTGDDWFWMKTVLKTVKCGPALDEASRRDSFLPARSYGLDVGATVRPCQAARWMCPDA